MKIAKQMLGSLLFAAVIIPLACRSSLGVTQTIQFDLKNLFGDGTPYLYSTTNAQIFTESFGLHATYWEPVIDNTPAVVTYKFDFPFAIQNASLTALTNVFFPYDTNAYSYLDVSSDGNNWVNIQAVVQEGDSPFPSGGSISNIVAGSQMVFVRNTFAGINHGSFNSSQFLRTEDDDLVPPFSLDVSGPPARRIYWTDPGGAAIDSDGIKRGYSDGSEIQTVASGLEEPRGIALDLVNQRMYWAEPGSLAIKVANLNGNGSPQNVVATGNASGGVALDVANGKIYWTDADNFQIGHGGLSGQIRRANLDGSDSETIVSNLVHPAGIAVDRVHGKIYWTELEMKSDGFGSIQRQIWTVQTPKPL